MWREFFLTIMKQFLIVLIFFVAGCGGNDKKASENDTITDANINGEVLFKANCASCHKPDMDFTGPALKGALQRWSGDKKEMYAFIRNSADVRETNIYARELFEKWKTAMTSFPTLSDAQIDSIMNYCEKFGPVAVKTVY
jgi:mono/diheme cytochrome c family protein